MVFFNIITPFEASYRGGRLGHRSQTYYNPSTGAFHPLGFHFSGFLIGTVCSAAEHRFYTPLAAGSNPAPPTRFFKARKAFWLVLFSAPIT